LKAILIFSLCLFAAAASAELAFHDPVAGELVGHSRVVYIGEQHYDKSSKDFVRWLLPQLKAEGFTNQAMEMMNASSQPALDAFAASSPGDLEAAETLRHAFEKDWSYPDAGYLAAIAEAKALGIKVIALDGRDRLPEIADGSLAAVYESVYQRDEFMSDRLGEVLAAAPPAARVLVWTGALHSIRSQNAPFTRPTQPALLEQKFGITSLSFDVAAYDPSDRPRQLLKQKDWPRPSPAYFRAEYLRRGEGSSHVVLYTDRTTIGWDGILIWDSVESQQINAAF
jgi:hypothetical protein